MHDEKITSASARIKQAGILCQISSNMSRVVILVRPDIREEGEEECKRYCRGTHPVYPTFEFTWTRDVPGEDVSRREIYSISLRETIFLQPPFQFRGTDARCRELWRFLKPGEDSGR